MNTQLNPYYDSDKLKLLPLGFEVLIFEDSNLSWEFDILLFVSLNDGRVYSAQDSGCSCPKPFEGFEGDSIEKIIQKMERIPSIDYGTRVFETWNKNFDSRNKINNISNKIDLENWLKQRIH